MRKISFFLTMLLTVFSAQRINAQDTFVDLGLPSGTLWAKCNVGANSPEKPGKFFAWGETSEKDRYAWDNYKLCYSPSRATITKYCTASDWGYQDFTDGLTELLPEDDAATVNWGAEWQMPSQAQLKELINSSYTTAELTTLNGQKGLRITSKSNGQSIFLPASGYMFNAERRDEGDYCYYWSRSLNVDIYPCFAYSLYGNSGTLHYQDRAYGLCVRPVRVQEAHTIYDIPSGWKVNGTTTSGTYQAKGGDVLHFTPKNIPSGKKIKSIKVVKK